jgi:hypothetical protein
MGRGAGFSSTMFILASMNAITRSVNDNVTSFTALSRGADLSVGVLLLSNWRFSSRSINHLRGSTACGDVAMHRDRYFIFYSC